MNDGSYCTLNVVFIIFKTSKENSGSNDCQGYICVSIYTIGFVIKEGAYYRYRLMSLYDTSYIINKNKQLNEKEIRLKLCYT